MIVVEAVLNGGAEVKKSFTDLEVQKAFDFEERMLSDHFRDGTPKSYNARTRAIELYIDLSAEYAEIAKK